MTKYPKWLGSSTPFSLLCGFATGLRVLPREPARVNQNQRRSKEDLQLVGHDRGLAIWQRLGAVTALEQESLPDLRLRDLLLTSPTR